jgi:adenylylsulfate kinase
MVIWLVGLSGAGKTTIGRELHALMRARNPGTVFVDGDEVREVFRHNRDADAFRPEGRRRNAERMSALCAWLDAQGLDVVCCCLSLFEETREWNRGHYSRYFEVYVEVPFEALLRREVKNLYGPALRGEITDVVGVDIEWIPPRRPDLVIDNSADGLDPAAVATEILRHAEAA